MSLAASCVHRLCVVCTSSVRRVYVVCASCVCVHLLVCSPVSRRKAVVELAKAVCVLHPGSILLKSNSRSSLPHSLIPACDPLAHTNQRAFPAASLAHPATSEMSATRTTRTTAELLHLWTISALASLTPFANERERLVTEKKGPLYPPSQQQRSLVMQKKELLP